MNREELKVALYQWRKQDTGRSNDLLALNIICSPDNLDFSAFNFFAGGHPEVWRLPCMFYLPFQSSFFSQTTGV